MSVTHVEIFYAFAMDETSLDKRLVLTGNIERGAISFKSQSVLYVYSSVLYLMHITSRRAPLFKCTILFAVY